MVDNDFCLNRRYNNNFNRSNVWFLEFKIYMHIQCFLYFYVISTSSVENPFINVYQLNFAL